MPHQEQPLSPEEKLNAFRDEMRQWIAEEAAKKQAWEQRGKTGEAYDPHAEHINPDCLTDDDAAIWRETRTQTLTREHWDAYAQKVDEDMKTMSEHTQESRSFFKEFMANEANNILFERELEELERKNAS